MNMEEKGIVARDCLPATRCQGTTTASPRHGKGCRGMRLPRHRRLRGGAREAAEAGRHLPRQTSPCRGLRAAGSGAPAGDNCGQQFLHVKVQSVQIDVEVEVGEPDPVV